jgi:hypothetical protein
MAPRQQWPGEPTVEHRRHAVVGEKVMAHGSLIGGANGRGRERAAGRQCLGSEPTGEHRLADSLARHHVAGARRVAHEQHPPRRQHGSVDAGRDGPGRDPILELHARPERGTNVRAVDEAGPVGLHGLARA